MSEIRYAFPDKPRLGEILEISPGIYWLRMPLPFVLGHINLWLLEDVEGWCLVDTGLNTDDSKSLWTSILDDKLNEQSLQRVVVTHLHPDHVGLAGWLCERWQSTLWMTRQDYLSARMLAADRAPPPAEATHFYHRAGLSAEQLAQYAERFGQFGAMVYPLPQSYRRLRAGQILRIGALEWEVIIGEGHAPEHACLYCSERHVLIAGDQVLPTITPNVSVWPTEPEANPLDDWLRSCRAFRQRFDDDLLVLPSHGRPFYGIGPRLTQILDEHEAGLDKILENSTTPHRAVDYFPDLFRGAIKDGNRIMAVGETIAHINYLLAQGKLDQQDDAQGVAWYRCHSA